LGETATRRALDLENCSVYLAADLDGDHRPELLVASGPPRRQFRIVRIARDWSTRETLLDDLSVEESGVNGLAVADLDGDGRAELVYASGAWTRYDVRVAHVDGD